MITVISGTNREGSKTFLMAKSYIKLLEKAGKDCQLLDLSTLPTDFLFSSLYGKVNGAFSDLMDQYIFGADAFVIISPEYNGSYAGIVKAFIDGWDPKKLSGQAVAMVGVASGRQGNARGMDHLADVMNYLGLVVVPAKIPVSKIYEVLDADGNLVDGEIQQLLEKQILSLGSFIS